MTAIIAFIVTLGLLVFVHELGHFIAARRSGMDIEEFGFGFPPRLFGVQKIGGKWRIASRESRVESRENDDQAILTPHAPRPTPTIYSINWIPLGGFVRIAGEDGEEKTNPRSFSARPRWMRAIVLLAGVTMNFLLAITLFSIVGFVGAPQVIDDIPAGATVRKLETRIVGVVKDSPAVAAGIEPGDAIIALDGQTFERWQDVQQYIRAHGEQEIAFVFERDGERREATIRPTTIIGATQPGIGVQLIQTGVVSFPIHRAVWYGVQTTGVVIQEILRNLGTLVRGLVVERRVAVEITGPVGIAVMTGQVVQLGFIYLLQFAAVLSANLALLNVFPFPALDGGRLLFLAIEAIRRRALAARVERIVNTAGFAVLMLLIIAVTYHDILVFGGSIVRAARTAVGF